MSDSPDNESASSAVGPVAGERLAEARRLRQISLPDIARELHLDEAKVQALEEIASTYWARPCLQKATCANTPK